MQQGKVMFRRNSLFTRIVIGKSIGFAIGLIGLLLMPVFMPEPTWLLRLGILFWYTTVGAIIGVFGVVVWHPVFHIPMPWWFRAPVIGGWMNFVLTFFAYDDIQAMLIYTLGADAVFLSPFWIVVEGMLAGLLIGFVATKIGGEGKEIVDM
jgi:hypothetical protein